MSKRAYMELIVSAHAQRRLAERKIRPEYVTYTLRNGDRDEHTRDYVGVEACKKRCCNLVVVYAARRDNQDAYTVLTAYWREGVPEPHLFNIPKGIRYRKGVEVGTRSCRQKRNLSWSFWADPECEVS